MSRDDDPAALNWIKSQARKGAMIIGVCAGAKVVAAAGLLSGKRATTHWYYLEALRKKYSAIHYVPDRRLVVDECVATTTGISASMPMALTLIEAIAGRDKAKAVARDLGLTSWDAGHASDAFSFTRPFALTAISSQITAPRMVPEIVTVPAGTSTRAATRAFASTRERVSASISSVMTSPVSMEPLAGRPGHFSSRRFRARKMSRLSRGSQATP